MKEIETDYRHAKPGQGGPGVADYVLGLVVVAVVVV